jgi:hypothetical protein
MPLLRDARWKCNSWKELWEGSINQASLRGLLQMKVSGQFYILPLGLESDVQPCAADLKNFH